MSTTKAAISVSLGVTIATTAAEDPASGGATKSYRGLDKRLACNATSTPPVTQAYVEYLSGNQTLDLTALVRTGLATLNATGLKLQAIEIVNLSTTNTVTVANGDTSAYALQGGQSIVVQPGGFALMQFYDKLADVAAGVKNIKITATDTYLLGMVFG